MLKRLIFTAIAASTLFTTQLLADTEGAMQANVFVVKVDGDVVQGQLSEHGKFIPLSIMLYSDASGAIDVDRLRIDVDAALAKDHDEFPLVKDGFDAGTLPDGVKKIFDDADRQTLDEQLSWRVYTPIGSIGSGGYYGYGRYPSWGYSSYYPSYYPSYGRWDRDHDYRYTWGGSHHHGGSHYDYYYHR